MTTDKPSFWFPSKNVAVLAIVAAAGYFFLVEHRAHLWEFLPYLILLACPVMHILMHAKHGSENEKEAYRRGLEDGHKHPEGR